MPNVFPECGAIKDLTLQDLLTYVEKSPHKFSPNIFFHQKFDVDFF